MPIAIVQNALDSFMPIPMPHCVMGSFQQSTSRMAGDLVRLADLPAMYAWHAEHHTAAINWLRADRGW